MDKMRGKKKLKEKDIFKAIMEEIGVNKDETKTALREMINFGMVMYSYGGGASSVEIPSEKYLKEKGVYEEVITHFKKLDRMNLIK